MENVAPKSIWEQEYLPKFYFLPEFKTQSFKETFVEDWKFCVALPYSGAIEYRKLTRKEEYRLFRTYNYLKYLASLTEDKNDIIKQINVIRDRIIMSITPLAKGIVKKFLNSGLSFEDYMSECMVSMTLTIDDFDFRRKLKFSTYATWSIRRACYKTYNDFNRNHWIRESDNNDAFVHAVPTINRNDHELLGDISKLQGAILKLNPNEQAVLRCRFGLLENESYDQVQTLEEIGLNLKLTKERIRQIEKKAIKKLRQEMVA